MTRILRIGADNAAMERDLRESAQSAVSAFYSFYAESESHEVKVNCVPFLFTSILI